MKTGGVFLHYDNILTTQFKCWPQNLLLIFSLFREGVGGVEEVCTIATLQRILSPERAQAKLVSIHPESDGRKSVTWGQDFGGDEQRREWHDRKMKSKLTRAQRQLDLMGLSGKVIHC